MYVSMYVGERRREKEIERDRQTERDWERDTVCIPKNNHQIHNGNIMIAHLPCGIRL